MVAFEISINGKPLPPMECPGLGILAVDIFWSRLKLHDGTIDEECPLGRDGTKKGRDTETLPLVDLKVGDEITFRIIGRQAP